MICPVALFRVKPAGNVLLTASAYVATVPPVFVGVNIGVIGTPT